MQTVSVVIIHHKTPQDLIALLTSLLSTKSSEIKLEICVINNPTDRENRIVAKKFPKVEFIDNIRNEGFSHAANQGVVQTSGEWILFLNPDVQITSTDVEEWLQQTKSKKYVASSPWFNDHGYHQPLPSLSALYRQFSPLKLFGRPDGHNKTLVGGCLLIKRSVIEKLGGWDERFFLWFEDSDLTQRLLDADYSIGFVEIPTIAHQGGGSVKKLSSSLRRQLFFHSLDVFARKHFALVEQKLIWPLIKRYQKSPVYPVMNWGATIVIPNVRKELLDDFLVTNKKFFVDHQIFIVTSALSSTKVWKYRKKYPEFHFILLSQMQGFAKTVNIGFRAATTPLIGTINDDVILNKNILPRLLEKVSIKTGSVNPVIVNLDNEIESAGILVEKRGKAVPITTLPNESVSTSGATNAACVIYTHNALERTGLFDEKFGSYLEDVDLSLRMTRNGFKHIVVKGSRVIHLKHQTSQRQPVLKRLNDTKNWWFILLKNWSAADLLRHSPSIGVERLRNISGILKALRIK